MSQQAVESLEAALKQAVRKYSRMSTDDLMEAIVAAINESDLEHSDRESIAQLLLQLASQGSIDAVAMMIAAGCSHKLAARALGLLAERSEDVKEGMVLAGLTAMVEEWAEGEVAAGRMIRTKCPKTGKNLYQSVEKKKP